VNQIDVEIDRIILTDFSVTPERAERIRRLFEVQFRRLLVNEGWNEGLTQDVLSQLGAPHIHLPTPHSDGQLANWAAQSLAQALRGISRSGGREPKNV
jgi:hypothetical protein